MGQWELSADSLGFKAEDFGKKTWQAVFAELIATLLFVFVGAPTISWLDCRAANWPGWMPGRSRSASSR